MLAEFTAWLVSLVKEVFTAAWAFLTDIFIACFKLLVDALVAVISAIPLPEFVTGGLGALWGALDGGIMYMATQIGVPQALAIIGAGYAFRLTRKFLTLFQW